MHTSERVNKIHVSPTMQVATEAKKMKAEGINVIDLSVGEPDFPTPHNIKEAAKKAIDENQTRYTINAGTIELRKAIAQKLKRDNHLDYSLSEIIVSNGAKQCVYNSILATVNESDEIIIPAPYWVSYPDMVSMANGKSVIIETKEADGFKLKPEQLESALTPKTKILILCNPSNPTGSAYTKSELESLAEVIKNKNVLVISDEIYEKLTYGDFKFVSFASISQEMKRRTILVNGVSKTYAMTGWRIGYNAGPEDIIEAINKIQSHSTSNASSVSQAAAIEALAGPQYVIGEMLEEFKLRQEYFHKELTSIKGISCYKPNGAFFLFPNVSHYFGKSTDVFKIAHSFDFAMHILYEAHIAAVPGSAFGAEGYMRFSYATSMENLKEAILRLKKALSMLS
ncbi:MAG: aspartate aminotransferase [Ignavibacteria bacterium RIFOXYB2_FULL_35_12]|nr:MAG: aspartate aminotransferase [Ignavibacteria bacterium GWA2_36_19]OGU58092.1 MAG: aspartate aminotransferase [Ignavibacteria bacterium GWF2_35_20]OGU81932.1 MAG: aspartate aminotransferase [Ignavibacteria bacterium RIFOXYA2_FULL_35_9]OGU87558.1 MAG: aspartate aminotransferase [Ignavibacteria bacterium RIFOXYC12_FULL_35_11]OGU90203.1 MAG: aspartate aminotransferase [Ignavibacteria bacterium RIFOXYA12_FULL_35_25]OGU94033.1 MAG: aspartate aminotransferase [Ignavibacteria bacterium RIFOXYB12